jgi:hypothetical protein
MVKESSDSNNNKAKRIHFETCEFQKCWHHGSAQLFKASHVNEVNAYTFARTSFDPNLPEIVTQNRR